jgi:hypothetical protein
MRFDKIPNPIPGMRAWVADVSDYHFVITYESGENLLPRDRTAWVGYTASWKSYAGRDKAAVRIEGRWQDFAGAVTACNAELRKLRSKA